MCLSVQRIHEVWIDAHADHEQHMLCLQRHQRFFHHLRVRRSPRTRLNSFVSQYQYTSTIEWHWLMAAPQSVAIRRCFDSMRWAELAKWWTLNSIARSSTVKSRQTLGFGIRDWLKRSKAFECLIHQAASLDYSDGSPPSSASWLPKVYKHDIATM